MAARILVTDDEKMIRWSLRSALEEGGYSVEEAQTAREATEALNKDLPDLLLLDLRLPDGNGLDVLRSARKLSSNLPVILITAHGTVEGAVAAIKEGAYDYVTKPFEVADLLHTVSRALETSSLRQEVARRREESYRSFGTRNIVADSTAMREVARMVGRVAQSEASTILLLGESGVGKGLVAQALHVESRSADRPFLNVTCTAIPETLLESELFGHERGAFTDARTQKKGLFELADGGTVFLDEIGDLSAGLQGKLLRVLEDKVFRRVGGTRDIRVSVRIIAATNRDLEAEVREGRFRTDLYYRLNVIPIHIPPLRERREDVLPLAERFVALFNSEFKKTVEGFEDDAAEALRSYSWPGNVRELRNAIERSVLLTESSRLRLVDLPREIRDRTAVAVAAGSGDDADGSSFVLPTSGVVLEEVEKEFVRQALERTGGNRTRAARLLGINRDQMRYRIEKFRLEVNGGARRHGGAHDNGD